MKYILSFGIRLLWTAVFLLGPGLSACALPSNRTPTQPADNAGADQLDENTVVFPAGQAAEFVFALNGEEVQGGWEPAISDLRELDGRLIEYLRKAGRESAIQSLSAYKRQAAGFTLDGQKIILANFFCATHGDEWKTTPLLVLDGGNCYFQVKYNLETRQIIELLINGEA